MEKERVIRFYRKSVYGCDLKYPLDYVEALFTLTGQVTMTARTMKGLEMLGFTFSEVLESSFKGGDS